MGNYVFRLPDVGEGIAEAEIVAWHVGVGEAVAEDQPLVDVMTDKATVEIPSPVSGTVVARKGETGTMAAVGDELVVIATGEAQAAAQPEAQAATGITRPNGKMPETGPEDRPPAAAPEPVRAVPAEGEVEAEPPPPAPTYPDGAPKPTAAPAVRARAAALGIDLRSLRGSGPGGRVLHADLDAALLRDRTAPAPAMPAAVEPQGDRPQGDDAEDGVAEEKLIGLRRQIAERMLESKRRIPHFAYVEEVDVTALEELRQALNEEHLAKSGGEAPRLTLLPFLVRALVRAIPEHPGLNAHFDDEAATVRRFTAVHMGVATQTRRGLVVPVIRHAERLGLWEIAAEIARLAGAARAGKATRAELSGSTITVSSLGALGGIAATPIINPPEVAIVGVNRIVERGAVRGGRLEIRKMMNLSSSFDHRIVDGFDAAAFIQTVKGYLEMPARLFVA